MKVAGINFSDNSIEAVQVGKNFLGKKIITAYNRTSLEEGIIENGVILKHELLVKKIIDLLNSAQPKSITAKELLISIPESQIFSRVVKFEDVKMSDLKQTVKFQLSRYIPFEEDQVMHDFLILQQDQDSVEVLIIAVPKKILNDYIKIEANSDYKLKAVELESVSSARAVLKNIAEPVLLVDIGARTTIVSFFINKGLVFTYNIPVAGNDFTQHIMKNLDVNEREAEQLKRNQGLTEANAKKNITPLLEDALKPIYKALQDGLQYFEKKYEKPVSKAVLIGGSAQLKGLAEHFTDELSIPCELGTILSLAGKNDIINKIKEEELFYCNAVGLALESSDSKKTINFLKD